MKRKFLIGAFCASMVVTSVAPAFASEPSITTDIYNAEGQADCTVTIDGGESSFEVILPKLMDGNAVSKSINWDYTVTVSGDIAGTESIKVVPEDTVILKQDNKANVIGTIKQNKTVFNCEEVRKTTSTTGNVSASGLSAGDWAGSFWFNINMDNIQVLLVEAFDMNDTDLHARGFEIKSIILQEGVISIKDSGIRYCTSLTSINFPSTLESIVHWALADNTALTTINLNDGIKLIGVGAFGNCTNLKKIYIPSSVSEILNTTVNQGDYSAFFNCPSVKIYCGASSRPSGWYKYWNRKDMSTSNPSSSQLLPVYYGYTREQFNALP